MRKSNWSDLLSALAMSERDRVRRLFESAIMKALAVISDIKTTFRHKTLERCKMKSMNHALSQALQKRTGAR